MIRYEEGSEDGDAKIVVNASFDGDHVDVAVSDNCNCTKPAEEADLCFDQYTKLACRIFKVARAGVSLMCSHRGWLKSSFNIFEDSLSPAADNSLLSLFTHSLSRKDSPCVTVVEDTLLHCELSFRPFVVGPPFIRFYAAAPLFVKGQQVGVLCLIHHTTKTFEQKDVEMLTELAGIISSMIEAKEQRVAKSRHEIAKLNVAVSYHLKHPLSLLTKHFDLLEREYHAYALHTKQHEKSERTASRPMGCYLGDLTSKLQSFQRSCRELEDMLELSLQLASQHIDSSAYHLLRRSSFRSPSRCGLQVHSGIIDLCCLVKQVKAKLQQAAVLPCSVEWRLRGCSEPKDNGLPTDGNICGNHYLTYPIVLQATVLSALGHLSQQWHDIVVQFAYKDTQEKLCCAGAVGYIEIGLVCSGSKGQSTPFDHLFEEVVLKGVLSLAGGYMEKTTGPENACSYSCSIPVLELISALQVRQSPQAVIAKHIVSASVSSHAEHSESCNVSVAGTESVESIDPLDCSSSPRVISNKHHSYRSVTQIVAGEEDGYVDQSPRLKRGSSDHSVQSSVGSGKFVSGAVNSALTMVRSVFDLKSARKVVPG
eukprot:gene31321-37850_t